MMDVHHDEPILNHSTTPGSKPPVVRGARACTVCRAAKMKCVGAEDGQKQCQRCKRANVECVFEKHRRGRKPGSKLSEASKMLRRLEKGLNTAKLKSQSTDSTVSSYTISDPQPASHNSGPGHTGVLRTVDQYHSPSSTHFPSNDLPPLSLPYQSGPAYSASSNGSRSMDIDDDNDDGDRAEDGLYPAKLIRKENQRNSFFRTILNPEHENPTNTSPQSIRGGSFPPPPRSTAIPNGLNDPITAGILDEEDAKVLFDLFFLRLNPFVNLFDPALHSVPYVRSKCPFLFTTLIMAGCKFFKPDLFKPCQKLANDFAIRAFAEAWKRVEVVQAFACLTYWKDPDDNRTWTYIGYACRMAVELGLNRYVRCPPSHETEFQMRERRNRERTYLVLFVHDRSLSMQTGRHWMLPEDDLIRHSATWHEEGGSAPRPEDVVVVAFIQLRRIAAETTDMFNSTKTMGTNHNDLSYEVVLRNCNGKLSQWMDIWQREMQRAGGESFHFSILNFFRLHVRLFLNSFGIQGAISPTSRTSPSLQALSACCSSALETLQIINKDFTSMSMLRYGQDSITVMTAYSAVFLLKLLRSSNTLSQLHDETAHEIHSAISKTADAYFDASMLSPASTSAAYHARFLRSLVTNDIFKAKLNEQECAEGMPIDPRLQAGSKLPGSSSSPPQIYPQSVPQAHEQNFQFPASPHLPALPTPQHHDYPADAPGRQMNYPPSYPNPSYAPPQQGSELDAHYWRNMFLELGFGESIETTPAPHEVVRSATSYHGNHQNGQNTASTLPYHNVHPSTQVSYGH